jgi:hypothetical protein
MRNARTAGKPAPLGRTGVESAGTRSAHGDKHVAGARGADTCVRARAGIRRLRRRCGCLCPEGTVSWLACRWLLCRPSGRPPSAATSFFDSSNWDEIRAFDPAPGRSREQQRQGACWPARVTTIGNHLRRRTVGAGVAPGFMPTRNSELIGRRGRCADDAAPPEIGDIHAAGEAGANARLRARTSMHRPALIV